MNNDNKPDKFVIREAEETDCALIMALIRELADFERLSHEVEADEHALQRGLFGPRAAAEALIAEVAGEPVGYALSYQTFSTFTGKPGLYVEDIYIRPAWRRRGFGERVFRHLIALAAERNYGRVEWAVLNWNQPAIDFYRRLGAAPLEEWTTQRISLPVYHQG